MKTKKTITFADNRDNLEYICIQFKKLDSTYRYNMYLYYMLWVITNECSFIMLFMYNFDYLILFFS
jgi:hypothetical protein